MMKSLLLLVGLELMSSYLNTHDFDIHKECWWLPTKIVKKRQGFYVDKQHSYGSSIKVAV